MSSIRILHVLQKMDRAGAETWLMHVLRNIDRDRFHMDFLVHAEEPGAYDEEIRALGSEVIRCAGNRRPWEYSRNFRRIMREHGPYDILHSHVQYYSGLVLLLARLNGIPNRIAHSHLDTSWEDRQASLQRKAYIASMKMLIRTQATHSLATSTVAASALFGPDWAKHGSGRVLYCGLDFTPFAPSVQHPISKTDFRIPPGALVVGHVGRFEDQKNHSLLVDAFAELRSIVHDVKLLLVGAGPLRPQIENHAIRLGLESDIVYAGTRDDVPGILRNVIDVFAFPSKYEGLGLALVEAQAAGVPCVSSRHVPEEALIDRDLVHIVPTSNPRSWAAALASQAQRMVTSEDRQLAYERAAASRFGIERSVSELEALYGAVASSK